MRKLFLFTIVVLVAIAVGAGVVRDHLTFRAALWLSGAARRLKAGEYRFDQPMTPLDVIGKIARGDVYVISVTFPEGLTMFEMAKIFESHGLGTAAEFVAAARDPSLIRQLDPAARSLEGYLFPETYSLPRRTEADHVVRMMVERFHHVFVPQLKAAAARELLHVRQLALVHPFADEPRVHTVEAEDDEFPVELVRRARRAAGDQHRETDGGQNGQKDENAASHVFGGMKIIAPPRTLNSDVARPFTVAGGIHADPGNRRRRAAHRSGDQRSVANAGTAPADAEGSECR